MLVINDGQLEFSKSETDNIANSNKTNELVDSQFSPEKTLLSQYGNRATMSEKLTLNNYSETIDLETESDNINTSSNHFNHNLKRKHSLKVKYERERKEINTKIS